MAITTVLFDLDGTLLPMDQDIFTGAYFKGLVTKLAPFGYEPKALVDAVWAGTEAMIRNTGEKSNEEKFWETFCRIMGAETREDEPIFEEFYKNEFQLIKGVCGYDSQAEEIVQWLKGEGIRVALATNPIFPAIATRSRIRWAGLQPEDFEFYTTYENSRYSKPNPAYYLDILEQMAVEPGECVMVGNDVGDDMVAQELGMKVFLLTDNLINKENIDISVFPHGSYLELSRYLQDLIGKEK